MNSLQKVRERFGLNLEQMAFIMKISTKRLATLEEKEQLVSRGRQKTTKTITRLKDKYAKFFRVAKIFYNLYSTIPESPTGYLYDFITKPHRLLAGRRPMDMLDNQEDFEKLKDLVHGIEGSDFV